MLENVVSISTHGGHVKARRAPRIDKPAPAEYYGSLAGEEMIGFAGS
jgi:hypothetical protein